VTPGKTVGLEATNQSMYQSTFTVLHIANESEAQHTSSFKNMKHTIRKSLIEQTSQHTHINDTLIFTTLYRHNCTASNLLTIINTCKHYIRLDVMIPNPQELPLL